MKPAGIAQMYPKNALGALEAISGGKGAGANVNKKRSLSFGTKEYLIWFKREPTRGSRIVRFCSHGEASA